MYHCLHLPKNHRILVFLILSDDDYDGDAVRWVDTWDMECNKEMLAVADMGNRDIVVDILKKFERE